MKKAKAVWQGMLWLIIMLSLMSSAFARDRRIDEFENEELAAKLFNEAKKGEYKIVATDELRIWIDSIDPRWLSDRNSILVVDTMPDDSYRRNHIPYAEQFEFPIVEIDRLDNRTRAEFEKVLGPDKDRKTVFYCSSTESGRSHNGAKWAVKFGYTDVYRYAAGIEGWMGAGNPTATAK